MARKMVILTGSVKETKGILALVDETIFNTFHLDDPWQDYDLKTIDLDILKDLVLEPLVDEKSIRKQCSQSWAGEIDKFIFLLKSLTLKCKNREFKYFTIFKTQDQLESWVSENNIEVTGSYPEVI